MALAQAAAELRSVTWAFATPIVAVECPDCSSLNQELARVIRGLECESTGLLQSNRGGWQSKKDLQSSSCEAMQTLIGFIDAAVHRSTCELLGKAPEQCVRDWTIRAWANINRRFHYNELHYHIGGFWSGVYYVSTPADMAEGHGSIRFKCPSAGPMLADTIKSPRWLKGVFKNTIAFKPTPGLLLLFPTWLEHSVDPHVAEGERISIGFDVAYG
jgi:uncharacterized protein (TIGR02466 family)